jgi:hypothetical protein
MSFPLFTTLTLSLASLLAGIAFGKILAPQTGERREPSGRMSSSVDSALKSSDSAATDAAEPLADTGLPGTFANLPRPRQLDTLVRVSKQAENNPFLQLVIARIANDLPTEVLEELLSSLTEQKKGTDVAGEQDQPAINLFAERLAARAPERAIALGTSRKSARIVEAGLNVLLSRDTAEALKAKAGLPKEINVSLTDACRSGLATPGGSFSDAVRAIQSQPDLLENVAAKNSWDLPHLLGALAAKTASTDPAQALAEVRSTASEFIEFNPKRDPPISDLELTKQRDSLVKRIAGNAVATLRYESASAASGLFDALAETEKNGWSFSIEAVTRFKHAGSEAAISFAESQASKENMSSAASGVWWALANQDRSAALAWIESLPPGAFREGALKSVMMDAWNRSSAWGDPEVATGAASSLLSHGSQVDYYAAMLSDRHFGFGDGRSRAEFIAELPLTTQEKSDLESRLAPVKPR